MDKTVRRCLDLFWDRQAGKISQETFQAKINSMMDKQLALPMPPAEKKVAESSE